MDKELCIKVCKRQKSLLIRLSQTQNTICNQYISIYSAATCY
jgi:hypothetical protein